MSDLIKTIEDRARLAGSNRMEVLMFRLEGHREGQPAELFGINVFKVRELIEVPPLMRLPGSPEFLAGMANIRGLVVPVIDLRSYCGLDTRCAARILVITEFNSSVQGFLVHDVDTIAQLAWSDIQEPPDVLTDGRAGILTAISLLPDERMVLILDVERVLSDVLGPPLSTLSDSTGVISDDQRLVYFVDDSAVARAQLGKILDSMGISYRCGCNGQEALDALVRMATEAAGDGVALNTRLQAVITDLEMPRMDGYVLTRKLKQDGRFAGIPVIMHSSLSSRENIRLGMNVGADAYIPKLQPREFAEALSSLVREPGRKAA